MEELGAVITKMLLQRLLNTTVCHYFSLFTLVNVGGESACYNVLFNGK